MSQPIKVDYASLEGAEGEMKKIAASIEGEINDLKSKLGGLGWQGKDATGYHERQQQMDQSIIDIKELLEQIAVAVGKARENYMATENANANTWSS